MKHQVLVTGAAGDQGGAVARHLIRAGHDVTALDVAPPDSSAARALVDLGIDYVQADLADEATLGQVLDGITAVFSVPVGAPGDEMDKVANAASLIAVAERAGVEIFVQTSTASAERHIGESDFGTGHTADSYGTARVRIEALVRRSAFQHWTILRPVALMENFKRPKAQGMFPWLKDGRLDAVHAEDSATQLVTVQDIARFTVAILAEPERFDRETIDLAGDVVTLPEIADILARVTRSPVGYRALPITEAIEAGMRPGVAHSQKWADEVGYHAPHPDETARRWGIPMTSFAQWASDHTNELETGK